MIPKILLILIACVLVTQPGQTLTEGHYSQISFPAFDRTGTVASVIDSTTLKLTDGEEVKLIGIKPSPSEETRQKTLSYLNRKIGREIYLKYDAQQRNESGQLLAYIFSYVCDCCELSLGKGTSYTTLFSMDQGEQCLLYSFVNGDLLYKGFVEPETQDPNLAFDQFFKELEDLTGK